MPGMCGGGQLAQTNLATVNDDCTVSHGLARTVTNDFLITLEMKFPICIHSVSHSRSRTYSTIILSIRQLHSTVHTLAGFSYEHTGHAHKNGRTRAGGHDTHGHERISCRGDYCTHYRWLVVAKVVMREAGGGDGSCNDGGWVQRRVRKASASTVLAGLSRIGSAWLGMHGSGAAQSGAANTREYAGYHCRGGNIPPQLWGRDPVENYD